MEKIKMILSQQDLKDIHSTLLHSYEQGVKNGAHQEFLSDDRDLMRKVLEVEKLLFQSTPSESEDKITITKSDGTGEIEILPEVKKLAITWIENYVPNGSVMPEIAQKWKLAEDIQRIVNTYSALKEKEAHNQAVQQCIEKLKEYDIEGVHYISEQLTKLKK